MRPAHEILDLSGRRRVFAAGDVHGEFGELEAELAAHDFDPEVDALVLVGDLTDRGPDSMAAFDWMARPWVHRVLGNHCVAPRLVLDQQVARHDFSQWGGDWWLALRGSEPHRLAALLEDAPVALTVLTPGGRRVGVVHADCGRDWDAHVAGLMSDRRGERQWRTDLSLWSRETINRLMKAKENGEAVDPETVSVAGIDHVFHGHTPLGRPFTFANRSFLDTGACFGGDMTVVDVDEWIRIAEERREAAAA